MKLSNVEKFLLILTAAFVAFLSGLYVGRNMAADTITIHTENTGAAQSSVSESADADVEAETTSNQETAENTTSSENKINLNTASAAELSILPGIGEVLAERIVAYRREHGTFTAVEEVMNVSGIGETKFEAMKDYITVG